MNPKIRTFLSIVFLLFLARFTQAQDPAIPRDAGTDSIPDLDRNQGYVIKAAHFRSSKPQAALGDYIKVDVHNIEQIVKTSRKNNQPILLFFNEIPMKGINPEFISTRDGVMIFRLTRDTVSLKAWDVFYQGQTLESKRKVSVSIGFLNEGPLYTKANDFTLILVRKNLLILALAGTGVLLILFIVLVRKTGIIRADNPIEDKGPFSLARTQLAFWTFIIIFAFIYIWIVTGQMPPVTGSTLILLTISMTTTAGASLIDSSKTPDPKAKNLSSKGFFRDIISDYVGVSIHRFQMVVWTILLGIFFLHSVVRKLSMPDFDESLLVLMGISSGTYLGLKIPEKPESGTGDPVAPDEP